MKNLDIILKYLYVVLFFVIIGCTNNQTVKNYYSNGSIKEEYIIDKDSLKIDAYKLYHKNGKLKEKRIYDKGIIIDTIKYFDSNGTLIGGSFKEKDSIYTYELKDNLLIKEGKNKRNPLMKENEFNGWIKHYSNKGLEKKIVYNYVHGKGSVINKFYEYDNGNILMEKSYFYDLNIPDTLFINRDYSFDIEFKTGAFRTVGFFTISSDKINDEFENLSELKLDTIYSEKKPKIKIKPSSHGEKFLRGKFTVQLLELKENKKDTTMYDVKVIYKDFYFEKKVFIHSNKNESVKIIPQTMG